jgi:hypothetical protein
MNVIANATQIPIAVYVIILFIYPYSICYILLVSRFYFNKKSTLQNKTLQI